MSVIAWDGRYLATDSAMYKDGVVMPLCKIHNSDDGRTVSAYCGDLSACMEYLSGACSMPPKGTGFITVHRDGSGVRYSDGGHFVEPVTGFLIDGQDVAIGMVRAYLSMDMPAHLAVAKAVETRYCDSIGGPVWYWDSLGDDNLEMFATSNDLPYHAF